MPNSDEFRGTEVWKMKGSSKAGVAKEGSLGSVGGPVLILGCLSGLKKEKALNEKSLPKVSRWCEGKVLYDDTYSNLYSDSSSDSLSDATSSKLAPCIRFITNDILYYLSMQFPGSTGMIR